MKENNPSEIHIYIDSAEGISGKPFSSIDSMQIGKESAMTQLIQHIDEELPVVKEKKVIIHIASMDDLNGKSVAEAIYRYCENKIALNERLIKHTRKRGRRLFWKILLIGVICIFTAAVIYEIFPLVPLPPVIGTFLTGGLAIISWVMLWDPIEMIVYGPSDYKGRIESIRKIQEMEIEVVEGK